MDPLPSNERVSKPGSLTPGLLVAAALPGAFIALSSASSDNLRFQSLLMGTSVVIALAVFWLVRDVRSRAGRVLAVYYIWLGMTLLFAGGYAFIFDAAPGSFRVNRDVLDGATRAEIDSLTPRLRTLLVDRHRATLLDGNAPGVLRAIRQPSCKEILLPRGGAVSCEGSGELGDGFTFGYSRTRQGGATGPGQETWWLTSTRIGIRRVGKELWSVSSEVEAGSGRDQRLFKELLAAHTVEEAQSATQRYARSIENEIAGVSRRTLTAIHNGYVADISEFVMFSASISTTIGSADVQANTPATRYLVILQSFLSVFLFGYAAQILWAD
jgi:hypothetical protein